VREWQKSVEKAIFPADFGIPSSGNGLFMGRRPRNPRPSPPNRGAPGEKLKPHGNITCGHGNGLAGKKIGVERTMLG